MNRQSVSLSEVMVTRVVTFRESDRVEYVINTLLSKHISGAPVINESGKLVGIISEKDMMKFFVDGVYNNMPAGTVSDYMSKKVTVLKPTDTIMDAVKLFLESHYRRIPIVDGSENLVGQVSRRDIVRALQNFSQTHKSEPAPHPL